MKNKKKDDLSELRRRTPRKLEFPRLPDGKVDLDSMILECKNLNEKKFLLMWKKVRDDEESEKSRKETIGYLKAELGLEDNIGLDKYEDFSWGGLEGEEAFIAYWNCD